VISAAVVSGTLGNSPARVRTANTSRWRAPRCNWPEIEPLEVNPNACLHPPVRGATLSLTAPERETVIWAFGLALGTSTDSHSAPSVYWLRLGVSAGSASDQLACVFMGSLSG
jgi:hypothetical protein